MALLFKFLQGRGDPGLHFGGGVILQSPVRRVLQERFHLHCVVRLIHDYSQLPLSAGRTTISLSLRRSRIALCCLLLKLSFGGLDPTQVIDCSLRKHPKPPLPEAQDQPTLHLPYVKGVSERIKRACRHLGIKTTFKSEGTLREALVHTKKKDLWIETS